MANWSDQQPVAESETISHIYIGDGLSAEIEKVTDQGVDSYRLTIGAFFASESVRFPYTQTGLENLIKTMTRAKNKDKPTMPIGGKLEPRDRTTEKTQ